MISLSAAEGSSEQSNYKASWKNVSDNGPHEAGFLKLNCDKLKNTFEWKPFWNVSEALEEIVRFTKNVLDGKNPNEVLTETVDCYLAPTEKNAYE